MQTGTEEGLKERSLCSLCSNLTPCHVGSPSSSDLSSLCLFSWVEFLTWFLFVLSENDQPHTWAPSVGRLKHYERYLQAASHLNPLLWQGEG